MKKTLWGVTFVLMLAVSACKSAETKSESKEDVEHDIKAKQKKDSALKAADNFLQDTTKSATTTKKDTTNKNTKQ